MPQAVPELFVKNRSKTALLIREKCLRGFKQLSYTSVVTYWLLVRKTYRITFSFRMEKVQKWMVNLPWQRSLSRITLVHLVTFLEIILAFRTYIVIHTHVYIYDHFYAIIIVDKYLKAIITLFQLLCSIVAEHKQRWALTLWYSTVKFI